MTAQRHAIKESYCQQTRRITQFTDGKRISNNGYICSQVII